MGWFLIKALICIAQFVLPYLFKSRPDAARVRTYGEFTKPTAESGRSIPVVFGTCLVKGCNALWAGNFGSQVTQSGAGMRYSLGMEIGVCLGEVDELLGIRWGDKLVGNFVGSPQFPFSGPNEALLPYYLPHFYGDPDQEEDGLRGCIRFYFGSQDQTPNAYMQTFLGVDLPAYPGLCRMVLESDINGGMGGFYVGNSGSVDPISPIVRRCPNGLQLSGGKHIISGDANPGCIIYELLTRIPLAKGPFYGLGIPTGMIDTAAFVAVAERLYDEGFGMSFVMDSQKPAEEWISEVCRHIDGIVFTDLFSGKITIRLARFDYDPENLPILDSDCFESVDLSRRSLDETFNVVRVKFTSRAWGDVPLAFKEDVAQARDIANQAARGGIWSVSDQDFFGITNAVLAAKVAERERQSLSYPFASLTAVANRKAWMLQPGSVFRLSWAPLGIDLMTVRVGKIESGVLNDGRMRLQLTEDIFSVSWTHYVPPPTHGWTDPSHIPGAPLAQGLHGTPFELARSTYEPGRLPSGMAFIARSPGDWVTGFEAHRQVGAAWTSRHCSGVTPLGVLPEAIGGWHDAFRVQSLADMETIRFSGGEKGVDLRLAIIVPPADQVPGTGGRHSEIIAFEEIAEEVGGGGYYISGCRRGVLDTVPASFPAGSRIWFIGFHPALIPCERPTASVPATSLRAKLSPSNGKGEWADWQNGPMESLDFARYDATKTTAREDLAYCAVHMAICGLECPTNISGALSLVWNHRNRLGVWTYANSGVAGEIEPDWCYHLYVYSEANELIYIDENFDGTSFDLSLEDEISLSGLGRANQVLRIVLETALPKTGEEEVLHAWQHHDVTFDCSGWGMLFDQYWGGETGHTDPA